MTKPRVDRTAHDSYFNQDLYSIAKEIKEREELIAERDEARAQITEIQALVFNAFKEFYPKTEYTADPYAVRVLITSFATTCAALQSQLDNSSRALIVAAGEIEQVRGERDALKVEIQKAYDDETRLRQSYPRCFACNRRMDS